MCLLNKQPSVNATGCRSTCRHGCVFWGEVWFGAVAVVAAVVVVGGGGGGVGGGGGGVIGVVVVVVHIRKPWR